MPFNIIRNDITKVSADAIVNTANPKPVIGGGTDRAIYEAAGKDELLAERKKIGDVSPGEARYTSAYKLKAKYIIHTVGPSWVDGNHGEKEILHSCYKNSLKIADELSLESIAFPLIATGVYGFPKDEALSIALEEIQTFLLSHEDIRVILVVFDKSSFILSQKRFGGLESYINEHYIEKKTHEEYVNDKDNRVHERVFREFSLSSDPMRTEDMAVASSKSQNLEDLLETNDLTFQQKLLSHIDELGLKDSEFYTAAGISKQVFSKLRSDVYYQPKKETAVAAALALHLDMPTAIDLIGRAGYAFSSTNKFDVIISYCIENKIYNIMDVNQALFKYDQKMLRPPDYK